MKAISIKVLSYLYIYSPTLYIDYVLIFFLYIHNIMKVLKLDAVRKGPNTDDKRSPVVKGPIVHFITLYHNSLAFQFNTVTW